MRCVNEPEYILSNDIHKLQSGTDKEDDIFDISRGEPATLEGEHLFHFMFLEKYSNTHATVCVISKADSR